MNFAKQSRKKVEGRSYTRYGPQFNKGDVCFMRPDIEQAMKSFGVKKMEPNKKEIKSVEPLLSPDETVLFIASTNLEIQTQAKRKKETLPGVCVITSRRFLFHKGEAKILGIGMGGDTTESIGLDKIDSVTSHNTSLFNHVQFHALSKSYDILCSGKKDMQKLQQIFEGAISRYKNPSGTASSPMDQIKQLAELRDSGIITNEEFEAKKADLLNRI